jgi:hypothetical protein
MRGGVACACYEAAFGAARSNSRGLYVSTLRDSKQDLWEVSDTLKSHMQDSVTAVLPFSP